MRLAGSDIQQLPVDPSMPPPGRQLVSAAHPVVAAATDDQGPGFVLESKARIVQITRIYVHNRVLRSLIYAMLLWEGIGSK